MPNFPRPSPDALRRAESLWASKPEPPRMRLAKFTVATSSGALLAYLDAETPSGLIVRDCKLMRSPGGGFWVAMPSQKQLDRDGNPVVGDNGKPLYREFVGFRDRGVRDRFGAPIVDAVRRDHPEVLEGSL